MKLVILSLWLFISAVFGRPLLFKRSPGNDHLEPSSSTTPAVHHKSSTPQHTEQPIVVGSYVGLKPKVYEGKTKENGNAPPHPGVVIHKEQERLTVAMISNNHPGNPPQVPISHFHPSGGLQGNVNLHAKIVPHGSVKHPWRGATGHMPAHSVEQLTKYVGNPESVPPHLRPQIHPQTTAHGLHSASGQPNMGPHGPEHHISHPLPNYPHNTQPHHNGRGGGHHARGGHHAGRGGSHHSVGSHKVGRGGHPHSSTHKPRGGRHPSPNSR